MPDLYNLINSIEISDSGHLRSDADLSDLVFSQPDSGFYWIAEQIDPNVNDRLTSGFVGAMRINVPKPAEVPFNDRYERVYTTTDSNGEKVIVAETEVVLGDNRITRFQVAGNQAIVDREVAGFSHRLYLYLALFGLASVFVNAVAILFGLRPLETVNRSLKDIRSGATEKLTGTFPREIVPLVSEVNALIDDNRRIVERARMQVGNLAHSLKTPIAVLINETRTMSPEQAHLVSEQSRAMQEQVQHYLDRARIAAQQNTLLARTKTADVLQRLSRVMMRLHPGFSIDLELPETVPDLAMEQHDVEEVLGNLLENASKWSRGTIRIAVVHGPHDRTVDPAGRTRELVTISIDDDGPGMPEDKREEALERGRRLDESKPGTGLGLSIVKEIVNEYQGSFSLQDSPLGGLRTVLKLPVAGTA